MKKMVVASIFSLSRNSSKSLYPQVRLKSALYGSDKILAWSTLKAFADDKIDVVKMMISLLDRVENTVGKREKCWLPAFSPFPTVFSKDFFLRVVESQDCVVTG